MSSPVTCSSSRSAVSTTRWNDRSNPAVAESSRGTEWRNIVTPSTATIPPTTASDAIKGFERSFRLVVETADRLEEHVTGEDVH